MSGISTSVNNFNSTSGFLKPVFHDNIGVKKKKLGIKIVYFYALAVEVQAKYLLL